MQVQHEHVISFKNLRDQVKLEFQEEAGHRGTSRMLTYVDVC
jgi:hypothetical protein